MEVRHQDIRRAERIAGGDEQSGIDLAGTDMPVIVHHAFQRAKRSGADRNDASSLKFRSIEKGRRGIVDPCNLAVHDVVVRIFGLHRQKSARADMQRDMRAGCARGINGGQQLRGKVQPCRR